MLLNNDDFPFTEEELRRALALVYPSDIAARRSADVARLAAATYTRSAAEAAQARGSREPTEINWATLSLPAEWYALLAELDAAMSQRVEAWRRSQHEPHWASRVAQAMWRRGLSPVAPATAEVLAELRAEDAARETAWAEVRARVARARSLPEAERDRLARLEAEDCVDPERS